MISSAQLGLLAKVAISQNLNMWEPQQPLLETLLGDHWHPTNLIAWGITSTPKVREQQWDDHQPCPTDHHTATRGH